jgi:hypothetical protein
VAGSGVVFEFDSVVLGMLILHPQKWCISASLGQFCPSLDCWLFCIRCCLCKSEYMLVWVSFECCECFWGSFWIFLSFLLCWFCRPKAM